MPIGSLSRFFADKPAILRSLAHGCGQGLHEQLAATELAIANLRRRIPGA